MQKPTEKFIAQFETCETRGNDETTGQIKYKIAPAPAHTQIKSSPYNSARGEKTHHKNEARVKQMLTSFHFVETFSCALNARVKRSDSFSQRFAEPNRAEPLYKQHRNETRNESHSTIWLWIWLVFIYLFLNTKSGDSSNKSPEKHVSCHNS